MTNLCSLFVLVEFFHLHYLIASAISFVFAIIVSFSMHKFWTFEDSSTSKIRPQFVLYLAVILVNLFVNTLLVYFFVEHVRLWYLLSQILAGSIIAVASFYIYSRLIFRESPMEQ